MADRVAAEERSGMVQAQAGVTSGQVVEWLRKLELRTDKDTGRRVVNAKQFEMVKQVAERAMQELEGESRGGAGMGDPL
eukprot:9206047-Pyramimonas_sp.AAC.1